MLIRNFIEAFQAGKELANATTWKKAQVLTAKLTVLLGSAVAIAAAFGYDFGLSEQEIATVASAISIVVGLFNGTATLVSTKRIGMRPRSNGRNTGGDGGDSDNKDSKQLRLDGFDTYTGG